MNRIDVLGGEQHFVAHLAAVWNALPADAQGTFAVREEALVAHAASHGIAARVGLPGGDGPVLVAAIGDYKAAAQTRRRIALMEHGAGQSYGGRAMASRSSSYAGGDHRDAELFLHPGPHPAARDRARYPDARVEIVGSPFLDTIPARERSKEDFTSLEYRTWNDLLAAMRQTPTIAGQTSSRARVCVAHAIASACLSALDSTSARAIAPSPNMTGCGTCVGDLTLPPALHDLARASMEAAMLAMPTCTRSCAQSFPLDAISVARLTAGLRLLSVGTRLTQSGGSTRAGLRTLLIPTTTFGSVSLAIPSTTVRADITELAALRPVISCAFHFSTPVVPEACHALRYFRGAIGKLPERYTVLGHGHPRIIDELAPMYARMGIELVRDFRDVARRADLLIADNTSAMFAFAATGRPVVVLNSPEYSRTIDHGGRFWDWATIGYQVDRSDQLERTIERALIDPPEQQIERERVLDLIYAYRSGASKRAADVLMDWGAAA